jgi:hypothetical protein
MPTLDDVYRKFGEVAEAGQPVETSLGNIVLAPGLLEFASLSEQQEDDGSTTRRIVVDKAKASQFARKVDKQTLGQLIYAARPHTEIDPALAPLLELALDERNRLTHHFYRQHNLRKNTDAGRAVMMADLENIHLLLIDALKSLSLLEGIDLDAVSERLEQQKGDSTGEPRLGDSKVYHLPI